MSKDPPLRSYGVASPRFWRNVTLIALAHIALIAGLIRWSLAARSTPEAESLVWLSGAEDLAAERSESSAASPARVSAPSIESDPSRPEKEENEQPPLTQAKTEIELPKPTPMETPVPKPSARPKATPKLTPKPTAKPAPKKTVLAKASKSSTHPKSSSSKFRGEQTEASNEKKESAKTVSTKTKSSVDTVAGKTGSAAKGGGHAGGGANASEFAWYGNMLHDRLYSAWIQPTTTVATGIKISTLVKVRIEKDGRISKFEIIKPSENVVVNESVAAVAKRVTEVDSPPIGLIKGDHYDVKINFELNTNQETAK
jgi:outer membrane biosynthesis protein TonB